MIVSTSDNSVPARISFRMLRTASLEKKPASFCARSSFDRSCAGDCVADFIPGTSELESADSVNPNRTGAINDQNAPAKAGSNPAAGQPKIQTTTAGAGLQSSISA